MSVCQARNREWIFLILIKFRTFAPAFNSELYTHEERIQKL